MEMDSEQIIVTAMGRLQTSGKDTLDSFEESKEINAEQVKRGKMVDWCGLAVHYATENLEDHEKIEALSRVQDDIWNRGKAPQEIKKTDYFRKYMDSLCRSHISDVESVQNEIEANRVKFEMMLKSKTTARVEHLKTLIEDLSDDEHNENTNEILTKGLTDAFTKVQKKTQAKIDTCMEQKARVENENLKFFEKMEAEFQQHLKKINAKDGHEKEFKEPVKVIEEKEGLVAFDKERALEKDDHEKEFKEPVKVIEEK